MSDVDLQRVAMALADAVVAREQGKRVRLPVIQQREAAGLTQIMHAQLDDAISRRDVAAGSRLACHEGCDSCCRAPVNVTEGEAIAVVEWLRAHAAARVRFERNYPIWRAALGDLLPQRTDLAWRTEVFARNAMCALNHEGRCTVYPVRPSSCRKAHALDTNEHCREPAREISYLHHPETEELDQEHHSMRLALHEALRPDHDLDLLCEAVHRLIGQVPAGRNDPCPCGSGKKRKKCCGA